MSELIARIRIVTLLDMSSAKREFSLGHQTPFFDDCRWVPMNYHCNKKMIAPWPNEDPRHIDMLAEWHPPNPADGPICRFCRPKTRDPRPPAPQHPAARPICRFCRPEKPKAGDPRPPAPKTLPMGPFCRFCRPERPLGALNCWQIGTRPSTIEKRGSMDRIERIMKTQFPILNGLLSRPIEICSIS